MNQKNVAIKLIFGGVILLFGTALAFFTASYLETNEVFSYWTTLVIFTGIYIFAGIIIHKIYSISLGFLFSGDILLLYVLGDNFGDINIWAKFIILVAVLIILYSITWLVYSKKDFDQPSLPIQNLINPNTPNISS
ncbi:MAG: hypothetical protein PHZ07_00205 [Patescibacteria group bacterium]|nr:hypothetical protein [Patescibacteria group bacterium]MDD4304151.1 hypothetical protein [Patescibacteria group bacterium]MDD4695182.1 hypothetical protein [Patescibacteria group bacterium]